MYIFNRKRRKLYSDINVTPFIDVMLVLLVIFMLTAPMMVTGVDINLPQANNKSITSKDVSLNISITKEGHVFVMKEKIKIENLSVKLKNIFAVKSNSNIIIKADKSLNYGYVMKIVSLITESGFTKLSLITESL